MAEHPICVDIQIDLLFKKKQQIFETLLLICLVSYTLGKINEIKTFILKPVVWFVYLNVERRKRNSTRSSNGAKKLNSR